jgi:DNA-binding NarL/FixJ family response regulator
MTRVLLADDQSLLRAGLRVLIDSAPGLDVVAEASSGDEAIELARRSRPDVAVMDIRMPGTDGLVATRAITSSSEIRVLVLTTFEIDEYVFAALRAGASGFIGKGAEPDELLTAIRTVARGESLLSPAATRALIERFLTPAVPAGATVRGATVRGGLPGRALAGLTERELEILAFVATGMSNDEIAAHLVVSPATVKTHVNRAMTKLSAHDRAQLVIAAYESGLVRPGAVPYRDDGSAKIPPLPDDVTAP